MFKNLTLTEILTILVSVDIGLGIFATGLVAYIYAKDPLKKFQIKSPDTTSLDEAWDDVTDILTD